MSIPELHANDWLLILSIKSTWKILNNMNVLDSSETFSFDNFNKPVEQMRLLPLCWHSAFSSVNISHLSNKLLSSKYQLPSFLKPNLYRHTIFIAFFPLLFENYHMYTKKKPTYRNKKQPSPAKWTLGKATIHIWGLMWQKHRFPSTLFLHYKKIR